MKRRLASVVAVLGLLVPNVARAGDAVKDALSAIPADAVAFVCVPSLKSLDADYQRAVTDLQLQPFVQPPFDSLVGLMKQYLPMLEGIDEAGSLALVFMPAQNPFEMQSKQALIVPAKDPRAMLEAIGAQAAEDDSGLWVGSLLEQTVYLATTKDRLIIAASGEVAKAIKESKESIDGKIKAARKKPLKDLDLIIWVDGERLFQMLKPLIDGFLGPMMAMQASAGGFEGKSAEMNKKNIDMFVNGTASMVIGVGLEPGGVALRFAMEAKPQSELAKRLKMKNTGGSLLTGLGGNKYLFAFGQTADPEQTKASLEDLDVWFSLAEQAPTDEGEPTVDPEKLKELKGIIETLAPMLTGMRGTIEPLPPGPGGLFGLTLIMDTTSSKETLELIGKAVELGKEMLAGAAEAKDDAELRQLHAAIVYEKDAEEMAGAKVQHLKLDLAGIEDLDEEDVEEVLKVIGKEGVLLRFVPVGDRKVVISFGGGKERAAAVVELAQKDAAPLDDDAGIKKVAQHLPEKRASVMYIAADQILATVQSVMEVLEEEALPLRIVPFNAPLALASSGEDGSAQFDMFLPNELLIASKDAALQLMGSAATPQADEAPAEKTTVPSAETPDESAEPSGEPE